MKLQWLGTAGFRFASRGRSILIDPYLSRNPDARPVQALRPEDLAPASHLLISHGHFDHLMDIPDIARATGAEVICSPEAARTLERLGLSRDRIRTVEEDGQAFNAGPFRAQAFYSTHVKFDLRLVAKTLLRVGKDIFRIFPLFKDYPCGQVLSWRIEAEGKTIHFFGSGGAGAAELEKLKTLGSVDLLLVPLQGHSRICDIGLSMVQALDPAMVIPHHHDDFYPPLSRAVDIGPFIDGVSRMSGLRLEVLALNQKISLTD